MNKIINIEFLESYKILCIFKNGERRILDLPKVLNDRYAEKVLNEDIFHKAKIGLFGQIYWEGIAEIKDLEGNIISCEYDISPEFAYENSVPFNTSVVR